MSFFCQCFCVICATTLQVWTFPAIFGMESVSPLPEGFEGGGLRYREATSPLLFFFLLFVDLPMR